MRYLVGMAVAMAVLAGQASAVELNSQEKNLTQLYYERIEKERADNEKAYNAQMKRLKAQTPNDIKRDPWATVRPTDTTAKR